MASNYNFNESFQNLSTYAWCFIRRCSFSQCSCARHRLFSILMQAILCIRHDQIPLARRDLCMMHTFIFFPMKNFAHEQKNPLQICSHELCKLGSDISTQFSCTEMLHLDQSKARIFSDILMFSCFHLFVIGFRNVSNIFSVSLHPNVIKWQSIHSLWSGPRQMQHCWKLL